MASSTVQNVNTSQIGSVHVRCKRCLLIFRTKEEAQTNHTYFQAHLFEPDAGFHQAQSTIIPARETPPASIQINDVTTRAEGVSNPEPTAPATSAVPPTLVKTVVCSICDLEVESKRALRLHFRNSHWKPPVSQNPDPTPTDTTSSHQSYCSGCNVEVGINDIREHEQSVNHFWNCRRKGIFCDACKQPFFTRAEFSIHLQKDLPHLISRVSGPDSTVPTTLTNITEPSSTHCFACRTEVHLNMLEEHTTQPSHVLQCKTHGLYCDLCECSFFTTGERFRHERDHEDGIIQRAPASPVITSTVRSEPSELAAGPVPTYRAPIMKYKCDVYDLRFRKKKEKRKHVEESDFHRRHFGCDQCNKAFPNQECLESHNQAKHARLPPWPHPPSQNASEGVGPAPMSISYISIRCEPCGLYFDSFLEREIHETSEFHRRILSSQEYSKGFSNHAERLTHFEVQYGSPCKNHTICSKSAILIHHVYCSKCKMFFHGRHFNSTCVQTFDRQTPPIPSLPRGYSLVGAKADQFVRPGYMALGNKVGLPAYCEVCKISIFPSLIDEHANLPIHVRRCKAAGLFCGECHRAFFSITDMKSHIAGCIQGKKEQVHQQDPLLDCKEYDDKADQNIRQQGHDENHTTTNQDESPGLSFRKPQQPIFFGALPYVFRPGSRSYKNDSLEFRCCDCDIQLSTANKLKRHLKICTSVPRGTFSCEPCDVKYHQRSQLIHHLLSSDHKPVKCLGSSACPRRFKNFAGMIMHLESGVCVSKINRQAIDGLIRLHDTKNAVTIKDAPYYPNTLSGTDKTKFLTPHMATVEEIDGKNDDEGSDRIIYTPTDSSPNPTGVLTPSTTTDSPGTATDLIFQLANPCTCIVCLKVFSSTTGLTQHVASPVHAPPIYHCPNDFFLEIGIKPDSRGGHIEREFKTLSALVQHVELGVCKGGGEGWKKAMTFLEGKLAGLGFGGVKLLGG
ncbi:hypothetical protein BDD12DRAFT_907817 [Trichophaea hybrida]|nr:hypothetical protein BDD12DRAFT_907817 [Trichophaea hybrida]